MFSARELNAWKKMVKHANCAGTQCYISIQVAESSSLILNSWLWKKNPDLPYFFFVYFLQKYKVIA